MRPIRAPFRSFRHPSEPEKNPDLSEKQEGHCGGDLQPIFIAHEIFSQEFRNLNKFISTFVFSYREIINNFLNNLTMCFPLPISSPAL
jgi:hypothetical protein